VSNEDVTLHVNVGGMCTVQGVVRYEEEETAIPLGRRSEFALLKDMGVEEERLI
jgi:hypothetical protein